MTSDPHPRYVVRTLRGWAILPGGERGRSSTTFMLMDSWYGYGVIMRRESSLARPTTVLRKQFGRAERYMNAPPRYCQKPGCGNELPRHPTDSGQRRNRRYCSNKCKWFVKHARARGSLV